MGVLTPDGGGGVQIEKNSLAVDPPSRQGLAYNDRRGGGVVRNFRAPYTYFSNLQRPYPRYATANGPILDTPLLTGHTAVWPLFKVKNNWPYGAV